tara:strand:- start:3123 stop:4334 length:1212 start_codon:yes stop_codon:yes gene_type:complete
MKKKRQHKSKYSVTRRKRRQSGGMYADNTVQSAGQGSVGTTSSIVFQESNPAILEAKMQKLEESKQDAMSRNEQVTSEIEQQDVVDKQNVALAEQESDQKFQAGENIAKQGMETYDKYRKGAEMLATNKLKEVAAKKAAQSIAGEQFGNVARQKSAEEVSKILADQTVQKGSEIALSNTSGGSSSLLSSFSGSAPPPIPTPPVPGVVPPVPAVNAVTNAGTTVGSEISKTAVKEGASKFAGVGGAGAAGTSGLAKFATSGAGIGTIAALAGTGISMLSDDGDPTKSNVGEYSGSILSSAGTGASVGSLLGPVGTAAGAVIGGLYGAGKQFFGTRKAKREEARFAKAKKLKTDKYNKELVTNLATANAQARSGEMEQKTYSGYDLGRNVVARFGGNRLQMPKYA